MIRTEPHFLKIELIIHKKGISLLDAFFVYNR